jgi:uncharacterized protein YceK
MKHAAYKTWLALAAAFLSGCGTVCNFVDGVKDPDNAPKVYGGVLKDFGEDETGTTPTPPNFSGLHGSGQSGAISLAALVAFVAAEPLLSFVADTLTLPITLPLEYRRQLRDRENEAAAAPIPVPPGNLPNSSELDASQVPAPSPQE